MFAHREGGGLHRPPPAAFTAANGDIRTGAVHDSAVHFNFLPSNR